MFARLLLFAIVTSLVSANAQQSITLAGAELQVGMLRESALAKIRANSDVTLKQMGNEWYFVLLKTQNGTDLAGDLWFQSGRLGRIGVCHVDNAKEASLVVKAFYNSVRTSDKSKMVKMWTSSNDDAVNPTFQIHIAFVDREVVMTSHNHLGSEITSVVTYYPKMLK